MRKQAPGLRAQLLLLLLPCIALLLLVDSWSDHANRTRSLDKAYDESLVEPLSALDASLRFGARGELEVAAPLAVQAMFESVRTPHRHLHVGVLPMDGAAVTAAVERTLVGPGDLPPPAAAERGGGGIVFYDASYHGDPVRVAMLQRDLTDAAGRRWRVRVQAAQDRSRWDDARSASLWRELRQDLAMLAVMALLVWLGISRALRPLRCLRESLRARPPHDLQPLDASAVPYEVAPLVDAVNHHIAQHRQLLAQQTRFLEDASHQLRTPIAIMMTQAGYALRERDPALLRETLRAILAQLGHSQRLSDQLLSMAHASRPEQPGAAPPLVDLNLVAREVVLQSLPLARAKDQDLGWDDARGGDVDTGGDDGDDGDPSGVAAVPVRGDAAELHEALANLVHNAIRHTPAHGRITVAVRKAGRLAWAEVRDSGPGIAPELHAAVFDRFARGGTSASGGAGLGLAIARAYARRNGGDIVLADAGPPTGATAGLCARLQLPLAPDQPGPWSCERPADTRAGPNDKAGCEVNDAANFSCRP
ncbi:MAG: sensor histidine kinase [Ramlibacter sp.]|nr:sensor histidine kinase [Ramlibacter sp.]